MSSVDAHEPGRSGVTRKDAPMVVIPPPRPRDGPLHRDVDTARAWDVASVLICIRIANAVTLSTFFQPDEFYQAWEPAWALAFGKESGAWLTWVGSG